MILQRRYLCLLWFYLLSTIHMPGQEHASYGSLLPLKHNHPQHLNLSVPLDKQTGMHCLAKQDTQYINALINALFHPDLISSEISASLGIDASGTGSREPSTKLDKTSLEHPQCTYSSDVFHSLFKHRCSLGWLKLQLTHADAKLTPLPKLLIAPPSL